MKSSITRRSLKLLSLASKVGRKELQQTIKDKVFKTIDDVTSGRVKTRIDQAKLIVEHLSQLKGAAMKVGQLLSLDGAEFFPPEAVELLSKLQGQVEATPWEVLEKVLVEELGTEKIKDFETLSQKAAASASIGQVHRGILFGRDVAVKIQYPGVAESIDSDLSILRKVTHGLLSVSGRKMDFTELFAEFSNVLKQEADYIQEKNNMLKFGELVKGSSDFSVPTPIDSHSTSKVLTMTWLPGETLTSWIKSKPSLESRQRIGHLALDLYCKEFFEWGLVQTDPNYANFLVNPENLTLGILDFGAVLHYTPEFRKDYVNLLRSLESGDRDKMLESFLNFGFLNPRETPECQEQLMDLLTLAMEPFRPAQQPFNFQNQEFQKRAREIGQKLSQNLRYSTPPKKIIFLHRKLGGVFALLKKLEIKVDLIPYWKRMLGE